MTQLRSRLLANVAGAGWSGVMQIVCVPLFIKLMGAESYGLVGFYLTLQVSLQALDLGLSATLNRELARYSVRAGAASEARDFAWTVQWITLGIGLVAGAGVMALAPAIASHWIRPSALTAGEAAGIVALMGFVLAVQWPINLYQAGLVGLQRQVLLNGIRVTAATLSYGGAVLVLWLVSPRAEAFFLWQLAVAAVQAVALATALWLSLPAGERGARFDFGLLRNVRRFAGEMAGIALAGIVVSQMDKIVLSRLLPLDLFGYYVLAGVLASTLQLFITPVFSVVFPRFSALVAGGEADLVRRLYHQGTQLMAVLVLPTAVLLGTFAPLVIGLWTGNPALSADVAPIALLLLAGTAVNGLMHLPYALQLAHGWTRLGLQFAVAKVVIFLPLLVWAASRYGAVGAAGVWALLNLCYLAVGVPVTHRRLLRGEAGRWFMVDVGGPLLAAWLVVWLLHGAFAGGAHGLVAVVQLGVAGVAAILAAALATPDMRAALLGGLRPFRFFSH